MLKDKWLSVAIFTLAFSILLSGQWIKKSISELSFNQQSVTPNVNYRLSNAVDEINSTLRKLIPNPTPSVEGNGITSLLSNPDNMYLVNAADYLDISEDELTQIINDPDSNIPYLKTKNDLYIFNKKALDKWLEKSYIMQ